jgi:hypothetical protein
VPRPVALFVVWALLCLPRQATAAGDYDPESDEWNGLGTLVAIARERGLDIEYPDEVNYTALTATTSLLLVYPVEPLRDEAVRAVLKRGGRMLLADDFGGSESFLTRLGIERDDRPVEGGLLFRGQAHLPIAAPVEEDHVLTAGVTRLVANHPTTLVTSLPPVFVVGEPRRTLVAVGAVEDVGRIVLLGDPSVLINNMLEMRGNARFARNVLEYLAGDDRRRILLLSGRFTQLGGGSAGARHDASAARREANARLARLSGSLAPPPADQPPPIALVVASAVVGLGVIMLVIARLEPRPRLYSGRWLKPAARQTAAGFLGTLEYLENPRATQIYPLMILKRELEEKLLDGLGLSAPAGLKTVLEHYSKVEPDRRKQKQLERLLVELSMKAGSAASGDSPLEVSARELQKTVDLARRLLEPVGRDVLKP